MKISESKNKTMFRGMTMFRGISLKGVGGGKIDFVRFDVFV